MSQKLSAMKYLKNNKRRIAVLIISLGLYFVLTYLTQFLLSITKETFLLMLDNTIRIQYTHLAGSSLGIDIDNPNLEAIYAEYDEKMKQLAERIKTKQGIERVYYAPVMYVDITPPVGKMGLEVPLVSEKDIPVFLDHMDASLKEGRLPEKAGEVVLDEATMKNNDYSLNDYVLEEDEEKEFKIVGILDCDYYFGCGMPSKKHVMESRIITLTNGSIKNISVILKDFGIDVRETYDIIQDYEEGQKFLKKEVTDAIETSTFYIYAVIMVLLFISLFVVYVTYLRDRHDEWCLYCSIGYSRKTIYLSILRELLFTFLAALLLGIFIIAIAVVLLDYTMIQPMGLRCYYYYPKTFFEIIGSYVLLLGLLQIPIRYALQRIRTIDAMEDEFY